MRAMADYTRSAPRARISKLLDFNKRLEQTKDSSKVFQDWDFRLDNKLVELEGRVLKNELICFDKQKYVFILLVECTFLLL